MLPKLLNSSSDNFFVLARPCVSEVEEIVMQIAERLVKICSTYNIPLVFKGSYKKANRTRIDSFTGIGNEAALAILAKVRDTFNIPVVTDIHTEEEADLAAKYVDVLQIPAFLCRQTDLLVAAAKTNKIINVKKGQFLAPWDMVNVTKKIADSGNQNILVTERGASFGYNTLVSDMRSLPIMAKNGYPVIFDATHSLQLPGGLGNAAGGRREFLLPLAKAGLSQGIAGLFLEAHPNPDEAKCDGPCAIAADTIYSVISQLSALDTFIKQQDASS